MRSAQQSQSSAVASAMPRPAQANSSGRVIKAVRTKQASPRVSHGQRGEVITAYIRVHFIYIYICIYVYIRMCICIWGVCRTPCSPMPFISRCSHICISWSSSFNGKPKSSLSSVETTSAPHPPHRIYGTPCSSALPCPAQRGTCSFSQTWDHCDTVLGCSS